MYSLSISPVVGRTDVRIPINRVPVGHFFRDRAGLLCRKKQSPSNSTLELWYDLDNCSELLAYQGNKITGAVVSSTREVEPLRVVTASLADAIPYDADAQDLEFSPCLQLFSVVYLHRGSGVYEALNGDRPGRLVHDRILRQELVDNPYSLSMGSELKLMLVGEMFIH